MLFKKPPEEGAIILTAREVREAYVAGRALRLVRFMEPDRHKVKPLNGQWPMITNTGVIDLRAESNSIVDPLLIPTERGLCSAAYEERLTVIPVGDES